MTTNKPATDGQAPDESNLTAFQIKERKTRTIFVGNVSLDTSQKQLKKHFKQFGPIEKLWFRSIATTQDTKLPERAKIITGKFGDQKDNKNAYILFEKIEDSAKALTLNQTVFMDKHLRVDTLVKPEGQVGVIKQKKDDFTSTIFIGNLPYVVSEEELRKHFA